MATLLESSSCLLAYVMYVGDKNSVTFLNSDPILCTNI